MEVRCDEGVATRIGPEPCVVGREVGGEADYCVTCLFVPFPFDRSRDHRRHGNRPQRGKMQASRRAKAPLFLRKSPCQLEYRHGQAL